MEFGSSQITIRLHNMLQTAFGETIANALKDSEVTEILVNPDGQLWVETPSKGRVNSIEKINPAETERIIRLVASTVSADAHDQAPIISAELPGTGERFEGLLPPIALAPMFAIRKPAKTVFSLKDYEASGHLQPQHIKTLYKAIHERLNILVAGGTGSGKTTLLNALLAEIAKTGDRVIMLEDTRELQCEALDCVPLKTLPQTATLSDLVRSTLRLRPDRIIVGEVRGGEALDMLKAWNTGHPGGLSTLHANSAENALFRLEQLIQEAVPSVPKYLIADTIDLIVFISGRGSTRRIKELIHVKGLTPGQTYDLEAVNDCEPSPEKEAI